MFERDIDFLIGASVFISIFVLPEVLKFFAPRQTRKTRVTIAGTSVRKQKTETFRVVFPNFLVALFSNPMFNISFLLFVFVIFFGLTAYSMNIQAYVYEGIVQMNGVVFFDVFLGAFLILITFMGTITDYLFVKRGGTL
jgi:hypothetical protein